MTAEENRNKKNNPKDPGKNPDIDPDLFDWPEAWNASQPGSVTCQRIRRGGTVQVGRSTRKQEAKLSIPTCYIWSWLMWFIDPFLICLWEVGGGRWAVGGGAPFSLSLVQLAPKLVKEDARIVVWSHQIDPETVERSLASMDWFSLWVPSFTTTMTTLVTFRRFLVKDLILFSNGGWIQDPCLFQPNISPSHPPPASFFFSGFLANFFFLFFKFFSFSFFVLAFRIFQDFYDC